MVTDERTPAWLARLLVEHGTALVLYARQWCQAPDDVVQEALVELFCQRRRPDNPVAWLYRAVRNGAISAARAERRRVQRQQRVAAPEAWFEPASGRLDAQEAAASLAGLEIDLREVVIARIWGGLPFAEIAGLVGVSLSTAQRRYQQAIEQLQARLEQPCKANDPDATSS
jgi:RNA polymerase sigma-70 factor (ECF subfamily)